MDLRDKILTYIVKSNRLNEAFINIVDDKKFIDDFKQHFYLQILEMDEEKLSRAYLNGYLDWLCIRIMINQWRSTTSSFYFQYKDINIKYTDELRDIQPEEDDKIDFDYIKAENLLQDKPEKWLDKQYHMTLFKLYYKNGHNYRQISEMTGININSIAQSITKSVKYLKKKIN
jgi:hypothetical protein